MPIALLRPISGDLGNLNLSSNPNIGSSSNHSFLNQYPDAIVDSYVYLSNDNNFDIYNFTQLNNFNYTRFKFVLFVVQANHTGSPGVSRFRIKIGSATTDWQNTTTTITNFFFKIVADPVSANLWNTSILNSTKYGIEIDNDTVGTETRVYQFYFTAFFSFNSKYISNYLCNPNIYAGEVLSFLVKEPFDRSLLDFSNLQILFIHNDGTTITKDADLLINTYSATCDLSGSQNLLTNKWRYKLLATVNNAIYESPDYFFNVLDNWEI